MEEKTTFKFGDKKGEQHSKKKTNKINKNKPHSVHFGQML